MQPEDWATFSRKSLSLEFKYDYKASQQDLQETATSPVDLNAGDYTGTIGSTRALSHPTSTRSRNDNSNTDREPNSSTQRRNSNNTWRKEGSRIHKNREANRKNK